MTIGFRTKKRAIPLALTLVVAGGLVVATPIHTDAVVVPPTFVATLLKALPTIGSVIGNLFSPTDKKKTATPAQKTAIDTMTAQSDAGKKELATYAQREQVIWRLVSSSSQVSRGVSALTAATKDKSVLTEPETTTLTSMADFINAGIESIVKAAPKSSLFVPDSVQVTAIDDLLDHAPAIAASIQKDLKFSAKQDVETALVKDLHAQLAALDKIFAELDKATAAEIQMIAVGLAAVSEPNPPKADDKQGVKAAADKNAAAAFGNVSILDHQIRLANQDFDEALQKFQQKTEQF
jgi:hypothetical protein